MAEAENVGMYVCLAQIIDCNNAVCFKAVVGYL